MAHLLPSDINTKQHFWNAFDHSETEVSASWIVRFLQQAGNSWAPFMLEDLQAFYGKLRAESIYQQQLKKHVDAVDRKAADPNGYGYVPNKPLHAETDPKLWERFTFNHLLETQWDSASKTSIPTGKYIVEHANKTLEVTDLFIRKCFLSAGIIER